MQLWGVFFRGGGEGLDVPHSNSKCNSLCIKMGKL